MKKSFPFIAVFFFLMSCNPIMMKIYGIKDPELENERTIKKRALKYELDTTNIVTVNSSDYLKMMKSKAIPDAAIFDSQGKYIEYRQTDTSCNAGLFQFIPDLNTDASYHKPDSANLQTEWVKFRDLKGNKLKNADPADFYVFIYWAVWTGKLNKDHVKIWEDLAKNNKNCKIKVVKVNMDFQEYWDASDKEKLVGKGRRR
ncbi:hypothetical protein [Fluviicola taffensis]|uniref:hypothetical protein n=1 Tax=Fluviicola taffensis TaxID=191579 RepID=UPI0031380A07